MEMETSGHQHIDDEENRKAHYQQPQEFQIMVLDELESPTLSGRGWGGGFILHHQSESTQKEEYRHTIMAEIRQQVNWQQGIGMRQHLPETLVVGNKELIFVFLHNTTYEVAVVVQHNGKNGDTTHCRTFAPCQKIIFQFSNHYSLFRFSTGEDAWHHTCC